MPRSQKRAWHLKGDISKDARSQTEEFKSSGKEGGTNKHIQKSPDHVDKTTSSLEDSRFATASRLNSQGPFKKACIIGSRRALKYPVYI